MWCGGWKHGGEHEGRHHGRHEHGSRRGGWFGWDEEELSLGDKGYMALTLAVLAEQPGNGYDVVKALEEKLGEAFTVGPGSIYPVLQLLEDAGYVKASVEGERKTFSVTEAGQAYLAERQEALESLWARVERRRYRAAIFSTFRDLGSLAHDVKHSVRGGSLERAQLEAIREAIARARQVIEQHLAG